jgi:hypothetical protein
VSGNDGRMKNELVVEDALVEDKEEVKQSSSPAGSVLMDEKDLLDEVDDDECDNARYG